MRQETVAGGLLGVGASFHSHFSIEEGLKSVHMVLNSRGITQFFPKTQISDEHYFSIGQSWRQGRAGEPGQVRQETVAGGLLASIHTSVFKTNTLRCIECYTTHLYT